MHNAIDLRQVLHHSDRSYRLPLIRLTALVRTDIPDYR